MQILRTSSVRLAVKSEESKRAGIGAVAFGVIWEAVSQVTEHMFLASVADKVRDQIMGMGLINWFAQNPHVGFAMGIAAWLMVIVYRLGKEHETEMWDRSQNANGMTVMTSGQNSLALSAHTLNVSGSLVMGGESNSIDIKRNHAAPRIKPPCLRIERITIKNVEIQRHWRDGVREVVNGSGTQTVLLHVVNLPKGGESGRAWNVVARMRFFAQHGAKHIDIHPGVWLNTPISSISIDVGYTAELFLFSWIVDPSLEAEYMLLRDLRPNRPYEMDENGNELYVSPHLFTWIHYVEVILTDTRTQATTEGVYSLTRTGSSWSLAEATLPANASRMLR